MAPLRLRCRATATAASNRRSSPRAETRLDGFDDKIISLYARGMTVREIQGHLRELYAVEVSPDLISRVTHAVLDEVREWQNRPLDAVYPVVFFDALRNEDPRRERGQEQGRLHRPGARLRGPQARSGHRDRTERGRQVLAQGHERAQEPRSSATTSSSPSSTASRASPMPSQPSSPRRSSRPASFTSPGTLSTSSRGKTASRSCRR